jgi:N-acetylmuramoyl-L-alanine amidase
MLVLHTAGMPATRAALDALCAPAADVTPHYVVAEDGLIWQLVQEQMAAWHAGEACWRGQRDVDARSIGVGVTGTRDRDQLPVLQVAGLAELCLDILARHPIPPRNVVAHDDVAPERGRGAGAPLPWERLAEVGIGVWPDGVAGDDLTPATLPPALLTSIGYGSWNMAATIAAAQLHWRPQHVSGRADAGTVARLSALANLMR